MNVKKIISQLLIRDNKLNKNTKKILNTKYKKYLNILFGVNEIPKNYVELLYRLYYNVELKTCEVCGKPTKFLNFTKGYQNTCSISCSLKTKSYNDKILEKYGGRGWSRNDIFKKTKETYIKKYGVENISSSDIIKAKIKKTCLERYGVDNVFKSDIIKNKIKQKINDKYGVDHISKSEYVKNKILIKNKNKSDVEKQQIINKIKTTTFKKYGVEYFSQTSSFKNKLQKRKKEEAFKRIQQFKHVIPLFTLEDYLGCHIKHKYKCNKCNLLFEDDINNGSEPICPSCNPSNISIIQNEINEFIKSLGFTTLTNDRTIISPKEIDIFIPSENIGFEINGLYWHSELLNISKTYHIEKTNIAAKNGIKIIHIFENEWEQQKEIVKSKISNLLKVTQYKLYARNCIIKEMSNSKVIEFLNKNHLQGYAHSNISIGLYYNNVCVACMTFGIPRFNKKYEWELIRFATLLNTNVIGGASKLFSYFIKNNCPTSIISYSDKRWNIGLLYDRLGFKKINETPPNYWYFKNKKLFNRTQFQKHKLKNLLETFDPKLTEWENMKNNGWNRIWDCGNDVYEWKVIK
jgi:rubrerythrin